MDFALSDVLLILRSTPGVLRAWLEKLPDAWTGANEGPETWSPFDIVGHLIHGERTDWMDRLDIILTKGESRSFTPFDRFAQFEASRGKSLTELLDTFEQLRATNLSRLEALDLSQKDLARTGLHPELGRVTLGQLLATWVAHDLNHLGQIARVMSRQYTKEVGPWIEYLPLLQARR